MKEQRVAEGIYRREGSKFLQIRFPLGGKQVRKSSGTTSVKKAKDKRRKLMDAYESGTQIGNADKVKISDLKGLIETDYDLNHRRGKERMLQHWAHLEKVFALAERAMKVNAIRLDEYARVRDKEGASPQTIKNELSTLRRAFSLAVAKGVLAVMPTFTLAKVQNARSGFFSDAEIGLVLLELPQDVRDLVDFLASTGWRLSEGRLLTWASVDRDEGTIRLEENRSKSGKPRLFPYSQAPALKTLLEKRYEVRQGGYVFHYRGEPVAEGRIRHTWKNACRKAGLVGKLLHDLRRSFARDMRRSGISEGVIMKLAGWRTRSMFDRYNVIDEADLSQAIAKRFQPNTTHNTSNTPAN